MSDTPQAPPPEALIRPLARLLRPLVRLLMRSGVTFPVLSDLLRGLYVEVAQQDLLPDKRTQTDSRISLLTGVHRKEIRRLRLEPPAADETPGVVTLSSQIIGRWLGIVPWVDGHGAPLPLPRLAATESGPSFEALVESVTKDVRARAVLDEWLSQGIVALDAEDRVVLNVDAFVPRPGRAEQLFYFARNLHDHIAAAAANISARGTAPYLDRSVHYDQLPVDVAGTLEALGREAAQKMLVEINRAALRLTEAAPPAEGPTRRVNLGVYLYTESEPHLDDAPGGEN
jgi:hypothetical protein